MKLTLSWLKDFLDTDATLPDITDALNNLGLEVEAVYDPAHKLGDFKVGHIVNAVQHPNADKLRVCTVATDTGELQIVCGADNARAGIKVCVSTVGMMIPAFKTVLKKGKIRDIDSFGMLCSYEELGLDGDSDGIIELPESAVVGQRVIDVLGINDPVIEISVTPNRPDALGVYGIARDLSAFGLGTLKPLTIPDIISSDNASPFSVTLMDAASCPHFVGVYIQNVKNIASPDFIQKRLKAIGCTPKSSLVDITNYMSYSFARPLHVFDADKIGKNISVRLAQTGETLKALDGNDYVLKNTDIVIADENKVLALAGIMGGLESGCDENTTNVFLESAYFTPSFIAQTGRRLNLLSDARYRFERGIDPKFTLGGANIATQMILELCGGQVQQSINVGTVPLPDQAFTLSSDDTLCITGVNIPWEEQQAILIRLGFKIIAQGAKIICIPPSYRPDIKGSVDFVEEIIRIYGINKVHSLMLPAMENPKAVLNDSQKRLVTLRKNAVMRGMNEIISYSFIEQDKAVLFGGGGDNLRLSNPISSELSDMRPSLLPNLLETIKRNHARGVRNLSLFEIGRVFHDIAPDAQKDNFASIKYGCTGNKHWSGDVRPYDIYDTKADVLSLLEIMGVPIAGLQTSSDAPSYYHPKRSGTFKLGKMIYAYFGEIHPQILEAYDIGTRVMACEILLDDIPLPKAKNTTSLPPLVVHNLQAVTRDFAFVIHDTLEAEILLRAVRKAEKKLITGIDIFDVYQGEHIEKGKKSVAITVTLQPTEKSLTDAEIDIISQNIITEGAAIGAFLR